MYKLVLLRHGETDLELLDGLVGGEVVGIGIAHELIGRGERRDPSRVVGKGDRAGPGVEVIWSEEGEERVLVDCPHFSLREQRVRGRIEQETRSTCAVVTCFDGQGTLSTSDGQTTLAAMQTVLVPADAGSWCVEVEGPSASLLVATPKF